MFQVDSLIFKLVYRLVFAFSLLLSVYLFFRGHNEPGGGFIGGLTAALAIAVLSFDIGTQEVKRLLRIEPLRLALIGVVICVVSALIGPALNGRFMQQYNGHFDLPIIGGLHIGTPLLFDLGVFLVVVGVFLRLLFSLSAAVEEKTGLTAAEQEDILSSAFQPVSCPSEPSKGERDAD